MNENMIATWNSIVKYDDHVYVLGDLIMRVGPTIFWETLNKLNGTKKLLPGNHDKKGLKKVFSRFDVGKNTLEESIVETSINGQLYVLCHYPIENWDRKHWGAIHLHGHSHGTSRFIPNRVDVGWDVFNKPMPMDEELVAKYEEFIKTRETRPATSYTE